METTVLPVKETNIFRLGEICLKLTSFVFETLGEASAETVAEISEILKEMPVDTTARQFQRFRSGEFSYQVLQHFRHTDNSVGSEHYRVDFEVRLEHAAATVVRLTGSGHNASYDYWDTILISGLKADCENEDWKKFAAGFVQKINETADKDW